MTNTLSPLRALRAALFAAVCVTLAAVGHSSMSAHGVPPGSLLLALAGTAAPAWLAAGRRRGTVFIGTALLTAQGVLHLTFMGGGGHHGHAPPPGATPHAMPGMAHGTAVPDGPGTAGGPGTPANPGGRADLFAGLADGLTPGMVAVHLLAAAVCALWLARGEAAFFRLARAIGTLAFTPLRLLSAAVRLPDAPRPPRPRAHDLRRLHGVVLAHSLSRRGPPGFPVPRTTVLGVTHV
ncbi:hypothetical protein GCM10010274_01640 [Streptomyces lavendofoliae]|uniref:Uncharacterized protein n=2 Tax=Streptomyces lavendofoliae TaxID=67314 RepID=A0A918HU00_9ACTN|nr:hypothetical protein GCM10010274_01640 [Streptomyces lavendofoliae]